MASAAANAGHIVKEGRLGKALDKIPSKSILSRKATYYWWVLKQAVETVNLDCYKDDSKAVLKEQLHFTNNTVEVDVHDHDNFVILRLGGRVTFLRAETRQQRDEWHGAILTALGRACSQAVHRRRAGTEAGSDRPLPRRGRRVTEPQTSPSLQDIFQAAVQPSRPLPPVPVEEEEEEAALKPLPPFCCMRHHIVENDPKGVSMADRADDVVYMNVHFVRSESEWIWDVESRRQNLGNASEAYDDLSRIVLMIGNKNDLDRGRAGQGGGRPPFFPPNLVGEEEAEEEDEDGGRRKSVESNEDNTEEGPAPPVAAASAGPALPRIPTPEGTHLEEKIQKIKREQRETAILKEFKKESVLGDKIRLMELNDGIFVVELSQAETSLRGAIKVGDQLIRINRQALPSASFAKDTISSTDERMVTFMLKRLPHGIICTIKRATPKESLGIDLENNEITRVMPHGLASTSGDLKPQATGVTGRLSNWAITEINTQPVDLFASTQDVRDRLDGAGRVVSLVLQPVDFIQMMRDHLQRTPSSH